MTVEVDGVTRGKLASKEVSTTNRTEAKVKLDRNKKWGLIAGVCLLGILLAFSTKWSFGVGLLYAFLLYSAGTYIPSKRYSNITELTKTAGVLFFAGTVLLSPFTFTGLYLLNEVSDCVAGVPKGDDSDCFNAPQAQTPAQLQARIPKVRDDFLRVGTDQVTVQIAYPVNVYGPPGHTMCVMPENTFSYDTSAARRGYITVIPPQVGTWIPVTLWWQKNPQC